MILYESRSRLPTLARVNRRVLRGRRDEIEKYIRLEEFAGLFGGFVIWGSAPDRSGPPGESVGVWGSRTIPRFRRILRERGATVTTLPDEAEALPVVALHQAPR